MGVKLSATVYESYHGNTIQTNSLSFLLLTTIRRRTVSLKLIIHVLLHHFSVIYTAGKVLFFFLVAN